MLVVLADTHRRSGTGLAGAAREAVADADRVVHAGDFTTTDVLDAFQDLDAEVHAVHGNADEPAVRDRLPKSRTLDVASVRVAVVHRRDGGETGLAMFGRSRGADLVISGHTHRPSVRGASEVTLLDPGSHDDPRGNPASHAELWPAGGEDGTDGAGGTDGGHERENGTGGSLRGVIRRRNGEVLAEFAAGSPDG